jgi:hypothetical protein
MHEEELEMPALSDWRFVCFKRGRKILGLESLEERRLLTIAPTVTGVYVGSSEWSAAFYDYLNTTDGPDLGFMIPTGSAAQENSLPWLNVNKISIEFSEDVHVQMNDLSLSAVNSTSFAFQHFFYDAFEKVATWTLAAPLPTDIYLMDLNSGRLDPVRDLDGYVLDGEWTNNSDTYPSGNGSARGDFEFTFRVMPGDVNQSAEVELTDHSFTNGRIGESTTTANYSAFADVDGSGVIESQDADEVWSALGATYSSGSPIGVSNDAPSAVSARSIDVDSAMGDVSIWLYHDFQDAETADQQLTYQIIENTNPLLFQTASINPSTGVLTLNAADNQSGRGTVTVKATDQVGLWTTVTYVVDVNYTNQLPTLSFVVLPVEGTTFRVVGSVTDDDVNLEGLYVEFSGAFDARASVRADGSFEFCVVVPESDWGTVYGAVTDLQSDIAATHEDTVGVT